MNNTTPLSDNPADWPVEVHEALDYLISKGFTWQDYKAALGAQQEEGEDDPLGAEVICCVAHAADGLSHSFECRKAPSSPAEVGQAMGEGA